MKLMIFTIIYYYIKEYINKIHCLLKMLRDFLDLRLLRMNCESELSD